MIKTIVKQIIPPMVWSKLRLWKTHREVKKYKHRVVEHNYGGHDLKVLIADPLGEGWYDHDGEKLPEIEFLKQSQLKPGAKVFDLGAHQCVVAMMLTRAAGEGGQVIALEANSHNYKVCTENIKLNNIKNLNVLHAAIAETKGTLTFNEGLNGAVDDGTGEWGETTVDSLSIDDLTSQYGTPNVIFLDVEGYECKALKGAQKTLKMKADWFIEVHGQQAIGKFGDDAESVIDFFPKDQYDLFFAKQHDSFMPFEYDKSLFQNRFYLIARAKIS